MQAQLSITTKPDGTINSIVVNFRESGGFNAPDGRMISLAFDADRADCKVGQDKWTYTNYPTYSPAIGISTPNDDSTHYADLDELARHLKILE